MCAAAAHSGTRLRLEKIFHAPPERVFAAFADAEQLRRWWGPRGFTVADVRFDPLEGRDYRIAMQPPEGNVFHIRGTFRAVEPSRRLAFTFLYEEPDPDDQETVVTVTFEPAEEGSRVTVDQGPFKTPARRALHRDGWTESLDRITESMS